MAAARASHRPLTSSQMTFIRKEGTPPPGSTSRPKGQNHSAAQLEALAAYRDAHNGHAPQQPRDQPPDSLPQAREKKPDHIA